MHFSSPRGLASGAPPAAFRASPGAPPERSQAAPIAPPTLSWNEVALDTLSPASPPARRWTRRQHGIIAAAKWVAPPLIVGLGATLRVRLPESLPPEVLADPPQPAIYAFWHRYLLPIAWYLRGRRFGILVSQHFDGEWIGQAAARLGYEIYRGSSTRGGREALAEMEQGLLRGVPMGLTVDGPRGPRYEVKPGAIYLARITGAPLYAIHVEMESAWELNSWDGLQVPKPGSIVRGHWRGPFRVPADASPDELEACRVRLELTLNQLRESQGALP